MPKTNLTQGMISVIVEYYKANNFKETCLHFHISKKRLLEIFTVNDIQLHTKEEANRIKQEKRIKTCLRVYGVECASQAEEVKNKIKLTNLEKYGVENVFAAEEIKEKIKETNFERYNVEYIGQCSDIIAKAMATKQTKYGDPGYHNIDKMKQTNLEKYGVECPLASNIVKEKTKQFNLLNYGVEYYVQTDEYKEKAKSTNLERYGDEWPLASDEIRAKGTETNLNKYGRTNIGQFGTEEHDKALKNKYGAAIENIGQVDSIKVKINDTKRLNHTFNSSKPEDDYYQALVLEYGADDIERQYNKDPRYPFACDFYIKSLDIFIELNLSWTHGPHKFDPNDEEDKEILALWQSRSVVSEYYRRAVEVWTKRDPLKFNTAQNNHLNYITFYKNDILSVQFKEQLINGKDNDRR